MTDQDNALNYPDVLGVITGGARFNIDVVQCALAARPPQVAAGKTFEIVLLAQNAADIDVDLILRPELPNRDLAKKKNPFATKTTRLVVGLRPAETGFLTLPVVASPTAQPGPGYLIGLRMEVKRMEKKRKPQRVRAAQGGGRLVLEELAEEAQGHIQALRGLAFSINNDGKKDRLFAPLTLLPPAVASLGEAKPAWISLWTIADYADPYAIARKVWEPAQQVIQQARRETVFMPLLKATQEHFQACGYPLLPPEAIFITKLLTLILEMGVIEPTPAEERPTWPRWFVKLCRLLNREPALAAHVAALVTEHVYTDLVYDAIMYGFAMVGTVTNEQFGTPEETSRFATDIAEALAAHQPMDFARAYLPLVLGGLIANARVTMPNEQVRETVFMFSKALEKRRPERTADNGFVFDIANQLVARALDAT